MVYAAWVGAYLTIGGKIGPKDLDKFLPQRGETQKPERTAEQEIARWNSAAKMSQKRFGVIKGGKTA